MVKQNEDGGFVIKNDKQAKEAANMLAELKAELADPDLLQMQKDATELSKSLGDYMAAKHKAKLETTKVKLTLVRPHTKLVIATRKDMPANIEDDAESPVPLQKLVDKETFMSVTKRVVDQEALDEAVREGDISIETVEKAFYERPNRPYVRATVKGG